MSINLKHLSCPAGRNCKAFKCIFGHPEEDSKKKTRQADEVFSSDGGPRKRPKRDEPEKLRSDAEDAGVRKHSPATNRESSTRPASPPAFTRTRAPHKLLPAKNPESRVTSSSKRSQKQVQVESLNPRLLKNSPASHEIRLKLLRMLHQEYSRLNSELKKDANDEELKLVLSEQELITKVLDEEEKTALEKAAVYTNVMKNKVMSYKRKLVGQWKTERQKDQKLTHGRHGSDNEAQDGSKKIETGLTPVQEVEVLQRIITPIEGLSRHGYVSKVPLADFINAARVETRISKGWEKCDRCQQRFQVFPGRREEDGALTSGGTCRFHWGKTAAASKLTPKNDLAPLDRAVCFDCEMGYTVYGLELVRLTATSWPSGDELLDVLVQPFGEILDLNSRYSGVWPDDLALAEPWGDDEEVSAPVGVDQATGGEDEDAKPAKKKLRKVSSPEVARKLLFSLISPATALIGHGLENDLNSVRIVHPTVVDTILLYPHKAGLPLRNGLKKLMDVHLNRKIQQETGPKMLGHDSAEDARAAGELVRLKVMEEWKDMKRRGWTVTEDGIQPPHRQELTEEFIEMRRLETEHGILVRASQLKDPRRRLDLNGCSPGYTGIRV
ncbi:hypothetical protein XA68_11055 [Ophiocordyceps unilateralis]|uniref:Exonuclease domain-containing protein n=1 Tax=Ophiocordyceps unilateralis TaxID=268505 RepID=A0A2A9PHK4_OPHUN|nr:hypothetical protein XA68_11055 [Ophiocordyceps unilateralis]